MRSISAVLLLLALVAVACGGGDAAEEGGAGLSEPTAGEDAGTSMADADEGAAAADAATESPKQDATLALEGGATEEGTAAPTATPTPTGPPTEGLPGGRYVQIDAIEAVGQGYAVVFTPHNFTPLIGEGPEDFHIHFFWDTVPPENAGTNGPDPAEWFLYDGPSPFTGYTFADRPPAALQMCALVADARHGVTLGSGSCMTLP